MKFNENKTDIEIFKVSFSDYTVTITYKDGFLGKTISSSNYHEDLYNAMQDLKRIFKFHMELMAIPSPRLSIYSLEETSNKDYSVLYKVGAILECNEKLYKLATDTLLPVSNEYFDNPDNPMFEHPREDYLSCIDEDETALIENVFMEAYSFIQGKRRKNEQPEFNFEEDEESLEKETEEAF